MDNQAIKIPIQTDASDFLKGFEEVLAQVEKVAKNTNITKAMESQIADLKSELTAVKKELTTLYDNVGKNKGMNFDDINKKLEFQRDEITRLKKEFADFKINISLNTTADIQKTIADLKEQIGSLKTQAEGASSVLKSLFEINNNTTNNKIGDSADIDKRTQHIQKQIKTILQLKNRLENKTKFDNLDTEAQLNEFSRLQSEISSTKSLIEDMNNQAKSMGGNISKSFIAEFDIIKLRYRALVLELINLDAKLKDNEDMDISNLLTMKNKKELRDSIQSDKSIYHVDITDTYRYLNAELKKSGLSAKNLKENLADVQQFILKDGQIKVPISIEKNKTQLLNDIKEYIKTSIEPNLEPIELKVDLVKSALQDLKSSLTPLTDDTLIDSWQRKFISAIDVVCNKLDDSFGVLKQNAGYNALKGWTQGDAIMRDNRVSSEQLETKKIRELLNSLPSIDSVKDSKDKALLEEVVKYLHSLQLNISKLGASSVGSLERKAYFNSKNGQFTNAYVSDQKGSISTAIKEGIKQLYAPKNGKIGDIYDASVHSHPINPNTKNLKYTGANLTFSESDLNSYLSEIVKDKIKKTMVVSDGKVNELDLSDIAQKKAVEIVKYYNDKLNRVMADTSAYRDEKVFDYSKRSEISNNLLREAISSQGLDPNNHLKTYDIEQLKVSTADLENDKQEIVSFSKVIEQLAESITKLNTKSFEIDTSAFENLQKSLENIVSILDRINNQLNDFKISNVEIPTEPFENITNSINNMMLMMEKAFNIVKPEDITNQWDVVGNKMQQMFTKTGRLVSQSSEKGKKATQELIEEYQKYKDMGGEKSFDDLGLTDKQLKSVTALYDKSIAPIVQESKEMEQLASNAQEAADAKSNFVAANKQVEESAKASIDDIKQETKALNEITEIATVGTTMPTTNDKASDLAMPKNTDFEKVQGTVEEATRALTGFNGITDETFKDFASAEDVVRKFFEDYAEGIRNSQNLQLGRLTINTSDEGDFKSAEVQYYNTLLKQTVSETWKWREATDEAGNAIAKVAITNVKAVDNIKAQNDKEQKEFIQSYKATSEMLSRLDSINASFSADRQAKRPILNADDLTDVSSKWKELVDILQEYQNTSHIMSDQEKIDIKSRIDALNLLVKTYQNKEYASSKISQETPLETRKVTYQSDYATFINQLKLAGTYTQELQARAVELANTIDSIDDKTGLQPIINGLKEMRAEFEQLKVEKKTELFNSFVDVDSLQDAQAYLYNLASQMQGVDTSSFKFSQSIKNGSTQVVKLTYNVKDANEMLKTMVSEINLSNKALSTMEKSQKPVVSGLNQFFSGIAQKWQEVAKYLLSFGSLYRIWNFFKQGVAVVREFDAAMTELKKVSNETTRELEAFGKESYKIAKDIGSTGQQIINSVADWERLGKTLKEAKELASQTGILKNVSEFQSIDDATTAMVSMISAFDISSDKAGLLVDKLNEVGNSFSISTDGIAQGLQGAASSLVAAGNDVDKSIALLTAANQTVQDPQIAGAGLRTIALRLRGTSAKVLEDMGEDTEGLVSTTSKLESTIKSLTAVNGKLGVSILDNNGNYKDTYEILKEISQLWKEIGEQDIKDGENRQAALLELMAGKNRSNILASILNSPDILTASYESSLNSAGSAQEELDVFMQSINGHLQELTNSWQEMWANTINRDAINSVLDLANALVGVATELGVVNTLVGTFAGGLSLIKGKGIVEAVTKGINNLPKNKSLQLDIDLEALKNFSEVSDKANLSTKEIADMFKGASKEAFEYSQSIIDGSGSVEKYAASQKVANAQVVATKNAFSATTVVTKAFTAALNVGASIFLTMAISEIVNWLNDLIHAQEKAIESFKNLTEETKKINEEIRDSKKLIEDIADEYVYLSKGVDSLGRNVSLTAEEFSRYNEIANKIAETFPDRIAGYNDEGNAILNIKGNVEDLTQAYKDLLEAKKSEMLINTRETFSSYKDVISGDRTFTWQDYSPTKLLEGLEFMKANTDNKDAIVDMARGQTELFKDILKNAGIETSIWVKDNVESFYDNQVKIENYYKSLIREINADTAKITPLLGNLLDFDESFNSSKESVQTAAKQLVSLLDYTFYTSFDSDTDMFTAFMERFYEPLARNDGELADIFVDLFSKSESDFDNSYFEFIEHVNEQLALLEPILSIDILDKIREKLGLNNDQELVGDDLVQAAIDKAYTSATYTIPSDAQDKMRLEIVEGIKTLPEDDLRIFLSMDIKEYSWDKILSQIKAITQEIASSQDFSFGEDNKEYTQNVDNAKSSISTLGDALAKLNSETGLTESEILELNKQFPELVGHSGDLDSAIRKLMESAKNKAVSYLRETIDSLGENNPSRKGLEDTILLIERMCDSALDTKSAIDSLSSGLSGLQSAAQLLDSAREEMKSLGAISIETLQSILERFPELSNEVAKYQAGLATTEDVFNALLGAYKKDAKAYMELMGSKIYEDSDYYNESLKLNKDKFKALGEQYKLDYKNWKTYAQAKLEGESKLLLGLGSAWHDYYDIVLGSDGIYKTVAKFDDTTAEANNDPYMIAAQNAADRLDIFYRKLGETFKSDLNLEVFDWEKYLKTDTSTTTTSNQIDWIANSIANVKRELSNLNNELDNTTNFTDRIDVLNKIIEKDEDLVSVYKDAATAYQKNWESLSGGLGEYALKIQSGTTFKIEDFKGREKLYNKITEAKSAWELWQSTLQEWDNAIAQTTKDNEAKYDNYKSYRDNRISYWDSRAKDVQNSIDLAEAKGQSATKKQYESLNDYYQKQIGLYEAEMKAAINMRKTATYGLEEWNKYNDDIQRAQDAINSLKISQIENNNAILALPYEKYEELATRIERNISLAEDLLSLMDNMDTHNKDGSINEIGLTKLALYQQQIVAATEKIKNANDQINILNKQFQSGDYDGNLKGYLDKLSELQGLQREAALSASSYRNAVLDLIKSGIDKETESMRELVKSKIDALNSEKALYEYRKKVEEQSKNISVLEKKIAMLALSTDRKDIAERIKLQEELNKAKEELAETNKEREEELKQEGYEKELEAFEKTQEEKKYELDNNLDAQEKAIKDSLNTVLTSNKTVYDELRILSETFGIDLTEALTSPWETSMDSIEKWNEAVSSALQSVPDGSYSSSVLKKNITNTPQTADTKLNQYLIDKGYKKLSWADMAKLGQELGIEDSTEARVRAFGSLRAKILEELKKRMGDASFSVGGMPELIRQTGEHGIALVKRGEPILSVSQGAQFKELVSNLKPLNTLVKSSVNDWFGLGNQSVPLTLEINSPLVTITGVTREEINAETQRQIAKIPKDLMEAFRLKGIK